MKLPYIVDTLISPKITGFNFIDRYAGVVRTINIAVQDQNDKSMVKRFPVACNITVSYTHLTLPTILRV